MTALRNAITATQTVLDVDTALGIATYPTAYTIESEVVEVVGGGSATSITVIRGVGGTTAAAHTVGATLTAANAYVGSGSGAAGSNPADLYLTADAENGDAFIHITATTTGAGAATAGTSAASGGAGAAVANNGAQANGNGEAQASNAATTSGSGTAATDLTAEANGSGNAQAMVIADAATGQATAEISAIRGATQSGISFIVTTGGVARATVFGLPTADPGVAGRLWIDTAAGRVIKVSA